MTAQSLPLQEQKPRFPFSMVERMMPWFPYIAAMGWMLVLIAFLVGVFGLAPAQTAFFSDAKVVREGAAAGSLFVQANVISHSLEAWVPQLKFFGLGLGLLAIVMALGIIAKNLRAMGLTILGHIPADKRPTMPEQPRTVRVFQLSALMGVMIMMIALVVGIVLAVTVAPSYWNHSIANELNPAQVGSALLAQASIVKSFALWLNPLRLVGMGALFTAITLALMVIIGTLRLQANMLIKFYNEATGAA